MLAGPKWLKPRATLGQAAFGHNASARVASENRGKTRCGDEARSLQRHAAMRVKWLLGSVAVCGLPACSGDTMTPSLGSAGSGGTSTVESAEGVAAGAAGAAAASPGTAGRATSSPSAGTGAVSGGGAGGTGAASAGGGTGGGGTGEGVSPSSVTKAEDCYYRGGSGGADAVTCQYLRVEFSEELPVAGLEVEVTTSDGDLLVAMDVEPLPYSDNPRLVVTTTTDMTKASGFTLGMRAGNRFSPEWIDVLVRSGDATAAESRLSLTYSCVALTVDDWCWKAGTEVLPTSLGSQR